MKKFILVAASVAILFSASAFAGTKIGIFDLRKVLASSPQVATLNANLKRKFEPQRSALESMQKTFKADVASYNKNNKTMKDDAKKKVQQKIIGEQKKLQKTQMEFQRDFVKEQNEGMKKVLKKVEAVVNKIATKNHFNLIIDKSSVAYNDADLDVTDQVMTAMKK